MTQTSYAIIEVDYEKGNVESYKGVFVTLDGVELFRICSGTYTFYHDTELVEQKLKSEIGRFLYGESHDTYCDDVYDYCEMDKIHL